MSKVQKMVYLTSAGDSFQMRSIDEDASILHIHGSTVDSVLNSVLNWEDSAYQREYMAMRWQFDDTLNRLADHIKLINTKNGWQTPQPEEPVKPSRPSRIFDLTKREGLVRAAVGLDFSSVSTQGKVFRIFQNITQIFIIVGFIMLLFKRRRLGFSTEYIIFGLVSVLILAACIFSPGFSSTMNATRIYHLTLFILAPHFIVGVESTWMGTRSLLRKMKLNTNNIDEKTSFNFFILVVLIPYFLFTSGFIFEITKQKAIDSLDTPFF